MHFVHITPEQIKRHPWIGVLIGFIGFATMAFVTFVAARDYANLFEQNFPELIDTENLGANSIYTRRWVTLTNPILLCERLDQVHRTDLVEKLIEGPVYDTYIPVTNSTGQELVIAVFEGDATCSNFQNQFLTGILTTSEDHSYGLGYLSTRLSKTTTAELILYIGQGPGQTKLNLILAPVLSVPFLLFIVWSIRVGRKYSDVERYKQVGNK